MANEDIKDYLRRKRIFQYEVADRIGISEGYLSTLLRKPLSEKNKERVFKAIGEIVEEEKKIYRRKKCNKRGSYYD